MSKPLRVCAAAAIIGLITFVYFKLVQVNHTTVALTLLLGVLGIAARWGLLESTVASVAGMLCFNYFFLPPIGKWTIADSQNWIALVAFLITAVVASQLSAKEKKRAAEAKRREQEIDLLYQLSRSLMLMDSQAPFAAQIASHIGAVFGFHNVVVWDQEAGQEHRLGAAAPSDAATRLPLQVGDKQVGALTLPTGVTSETALRAIAHLAALALDRARTQDAASHAEAARQSEELKSTLLDAFAHECKTPLTSIKAAVTTVLNAPSFPGEHRELLQIVDEETDRLTSAVSEAMQMARIEAGQIELRRGPRLASELIRQSLSKLASALDARPVEVLCPEDLPAVAADPELIHIVLRQLVDNAIKYSPPDSPITIETSLDGDLVAVSVADRGPGVPEADRHRIFEKFYRGRDARDRIPGTGMGLAIAREIVRAHSGEIHLENLPGGGCRVSFSLPIAKEPVRA